MDTLPSEVVCMIGTHLDIRDIAAAASSAKIFYKATKVCVAAVTAPVRI